MMDIKRSRDEESGRGVGMQFDSAKHCFDTWPLKKGHEKLKTIQGREPFVIVELVP